MIRKLCVKDEESLIIDVIKFSCPENTNVANSVATMSRDNRNQYRDFIFNVGNQQLVYEIKLVVLIAGIEADFFWES